MKNHTFEFFCYFHIISSIFYEILTVSTKWFSWGPVTLVQKVAARLTFFLEAIDLGRLSTYPCTIKILKILKFLIDQTAKLLSLSLPPKIMYYPSHNINLEYLFTMGTYLRKCQLRSVLIIKCLNALKRIMCIQIAIYKLQFNSSLALAPS